MTLDQRIWKNRKWLKRIGHVIYWAFFMALIGAIMFNPPEEQYMWWEYTWANYWMWLVVSMPFKWLIFYGFYYKLIPKYFAEQTFKFTLITLATLFGYPFIKYGIDVLVGVKSIPTIIITEQDVNDYYIFWTEIGRRFATPLLSIFWAFVARFIVDWFRNLKIKAQMEKEQLKSELAMLRNQVNPHFLFNVLNNIDTLVYPHSQEASEAIMKLSSIMRYMLYESNSELVPIEKEINYLNSYVELQKMRIPSTENIVLNIDIQNQNLRIPPMILIPFVENAFKHSPSKNGKGPEIKLSLHDHEDLVHFEIENGIDLDTIEKDEVGGIGLQNVKRRLDLMYKKEKYHLNIDHHADRYKVQLTLKP